MIYKNGYKITKLFKIPLTKKLWTARYIIGDGCLGICLASYRLKPYNIVFYYYYKYFKKTIINHCVFEKLFCAYPGLLPRYRLVLSNLSVHNKNKYFLLFFHDS